jgi:mannose-6-phosphate isomerase-like protein (cupin superfamily)
MMAYIPAGMTHTVWNEEEEPLEGIVITFGEGA